MHADGATRVPAGFPNHCANSLVRRWKNSQFACINRAFIPQITPLAVAQRLPFTVDVSVSLRAAMVLGGVLLLVLPGTAQRRETDVDTDLRRFYEAAGNRGAWIDARGRPTLDAQRVLARLRDVAEDGLEPGEYRVDELGRQAMALDAGEPFSAVDVAAFDVGLTASVLKYFRHLHLGRVSPRALEFHLDHAIEPHDFPERLRSALSAHTFDRVVETLRPPFAQYRGLRRALAEYRGRDSARARQIELALERLRWLPDVSGERLLVVNIPMFYLWGWDAERGDGIPSIVMAAITGRAGATKTPVFTSAMTSVVLNPEWVVPESILKNEILPAIAANSQYLVQHHMELTRSGGTTRVRQLPGPWNALGPIKFVLPNIHGVYLHGTPAPVLFKEERRDFSHGCVRVADPFALAAWVLKDESNWPLERIRTVAADGATRSIKVNRPPRVVLFYMTAAFIPEDGTVQFAEDVYGHDARLHAWLQAHSDGGER
jgi:murein L,D-transpeptidase YcbB/YkuD